MQTFKSDSEKLKKAVQMIKEGNRLTADAKKLVDAGKETVVNWLKEERNCNLETLAIGDMVQIEGIILIEIGKQNKFNQNKFQVDFPDIFVKYKEDIMVKKFKPLV